MCIFHFDIGENFTYLLWNSFLSNLRLWIVTYALVCICNFHIGVNFHFFSYFEKFLTVKYINNLR